MMREDRHLCSICGVRPVLRNRVMCAVCLAAREPQAPSPDERHLRLLRATGRDYAGKAAS